MKIIACCLLLWVSSGLACGRALQETVRESRGDPIKGAEIRNGGEMEIWRSSPTPQGIIFLMHWLPGDPYRQRIGQSILCECPRWRGKAG